MKRNTFNRFIGKRRSGQDATSDNVHMLSHSEMIVTDADPLGLMQHSSRLASMLIVGSRGDHVLPERQVFDLPIPVPQDVPPGDLPPGKDNDAKR
jgi:hypothetical protein